MSLLYTKKCNAYCRMCHANAGPNRQEKMSVEEACRYIDQAAEVPDMKAIILTGGEPLLFFDEVVEIISYARSIGFETKVISNAFWAETQSKALNYLQILKENGLSFLSLSADKHHQEFVPVKYVRNALEAVRKLCIPKDIIMVVGKEDRIEMKKRIKALGKPEEFVLISDHEKPDVRISAESLIERTGLFLMPLQRFGRGNQILEDSHLRSSEELSDLICSKVGRVVKVLPGGDISWCCYTEDQPWPHESFFRLGHLNSDTLRQLDEKLEQDPICEYLAFQGPGNLLREVSSMPEVKKVQKWHTCLCDVCCEAFRRADRTALHSVVRKQIITTKMLRKYASKVPQQILPVNDKDGAFRVDS